VSAAHPCVSRVSSASRAARALCVSLLFTASPWLAARALAQDAGPSEAAPAPEPAPAVPEEPGTVGVDTAPPALLQVKSPLDHTSVQAGADAADTSNGAAQPADDDVQESIPGDPWGDVDSVNLISLRALFQTRYSSTFAQDSTSSRASYVEREEHLAQQGDGWSIHRMFVRLSSDPVKYVGFKAVFDLAELLDKDPENSVKQVYATLSPLPGRLEFVVGVFKLPFSTLELDPSSRYEFASFGPANQLVSDLGYAGRDLGLQLLVAPLPKKKRLRLSAGIFQGHAEDEHDSPAGAVAGRAEYKPKKWLRLGADGVYHVKALTYNRPFNTSDNDVLPNPPDPLYPAQKRWDNGGAYSADIRIKKKGFMFRSEAMYGDRIDIDHRYRATRFWAAWGIVAYGFDAGPVKLIPAARAEWLDTDPDHGNGMYTTLSGSLSAVFLSRVRVMADVTYTDVQPNTPLFDQPKPLQAMPYLALDNLRVTAQLQLEL
jgi:hypothetical protein